MKDSGKLSGAIEVLTEFEARPAPFKACMTDWGRAHRFAGSGDRAWISDLCHDVLRRNQSLAFLMQDGTARALCLAALKHIWGWEDTRIAQVTEEEPYGPGALTKNETLILKEPPVLADAPDHIAGDYPEWLSGTLFAQTFDTVREGQALALRAPVDLRTNKLKADQEKALKALAKSGGAQAKYCNSAIRIAAPKQNQRAAPLDALPAYQKGWVEVQDLGSQLVSLAAGNITGKQVLDYCAGAGGKTLAMASMAGNSGQIFAWDADGRRLAPIFDRLRRAGTRNVQVRSPVDGGMLNDLKGKMNVVFVDAPCSGSGTWRRKPDTKWRVTKKQLYQRLEQQDAVLLEAAEFVKPGGRLIYVTCSLLPEENGERIKKFIQTRSDFVVTNPVDQMEETGSLREGAAEELRNLIQSDGGLQLTPRASETDGFFVATLVKKG